MAYNKHIKQTDSMFNTKVLNQIKTFEENTGTKFTVTDSYYDYNEDGEETPVHYRVFSGEVKGTEVQIEVNRKGGSINNHSYPYYPRGGDYKTDGRFVTGLKKFEQELMNQ